MPSIRTICQDMASFFFFLCFRIFILGYPRRRVNPNSDGGTNPGSLELHAQRLFCLQLRGFELQEESNNLARCECVFSAIALFCSYDRAKRFFLKNYVAQ